MYENAPALTEHRRLRSHDEMILDRFGHIFRLRDGPLDPGFTPPVSTRLLYLPKPVRDLDFRSRWFSEPQLPGRRAGLTGNPEP